MPLNPHATVPLPLRVQLSRSGSGLEVRAWGDVVGERRDVVPVPPAVEIPGDGGDLRPAGRALYAALFGGEAGRALEEARNEARRRQARLVLQLRFDPDAVEEAKRPWELLYDGQEFLSLAGVDVTRYVTLARPVPAVTVDPPLRVLLAAPAPKGLPALDVEPVRRTLAALPRVATEDLAGTTYEDLLTRLSPYREPVHVFDFEGHGGVLEGRGVLCFEAADGGCAYVDTQALANALQGSGVAVALINACRSADVEGTTLFNGVAAALILAGVPAVVGMQGTISDGAANAFLRPLLEGLSHCLPVTAAVSAARRFLYQGGEWYKPAVYLRSSEETGRVLVGCDGSGPGSPGGESAAQHDPERVDAVVLLRAMQRSFGDSDFNGLCFRLGVSRFELAGEVLSARMRSLIEHHRQHDRYGALVEAVLDERPHLRDQLLGPAR